MHILRFRAGPVTNVWVQMCPYYNVWPVAVVVVLHVKQYLQPCCGVFVISPYCSTMQIFRIIARPVTNLWAQMCPYKNVWPGAVYCCLHKNYNVYKNFNMTLQCGLTNTTSLQSFIL